MQTSSSKLLGSLSLAAVLLLGASTPRLAAQSAPQSYNFNNQSDAGWSHYDLNSGNPFYPPNTYSFPTNTAGPAGNYAYRMEVPDYTADPNLYLYPRGGSFLTGVNYGDASDSTGGRILVGSDLIGWNNAMTLNEIGVAWCGAVPNVQLPSAYLAGWGPGQNTLGIAIIVQATPALIGLVTQGSTVLQTNHQYRIVVSTHDHLTLLAQIFDLAQPNSPWQSVITTNDTLATVGDGVNGPGGTVGIMEAVLEQIPAGQGADATFDNFSVSAPAFVDPSGSTPAVMPATVTDLTPPPAGVAYSPFLAIGFLNRDTSLNTNNPNWVKLYLDGVQIPNSQLTIDPSQVHKWANNDMHGEAFGGWPQILETNFPGATINWVITNQFAYGTRHTNTVIFEDDQQIPPGTGPNVLHTNTWSWTAAWPPRFAPSGSLSVRGFDARLVVATSGFPGTVAGAQTVLGYPATNTAGVALAATNLTQLVAWDIGNNVMHDGAVTNYPGLCLGTVYPNNFAAEVVAYLQLAAGSNNLYIASDDAVGVYTGTNLTDTSTVLVENNGVTHQAFTMFVSQAGLYPIHIIHQEGGGDAYLVLHSGTDNTGPLVNDVGGVAAYYPLVCMSSTSVKGPYTVDAAANAGNVLAPTSNNCLCDGTGAALNRTVTGGTLTFPIPSAPKYYRLDGPRKTKITGFTKSGTNLVITYQVQ